MVKKIALIEIIVSLVILLSSCGQTKEPKTTEANFKNISELVSEPLGFDGQEVVFEGIITHICRHSGDKMRVNQQDDTDYSIMVMLEELQSQFNPEFEGKHVKVTGILKTVVRNVDALLEDHDHQGEEGHGCASSEEAAKKLLEKGITPDIRAFIELKKFEIIEDSKPETQEV